MNNTTACSEQNLNVKILKPKRQRTAGFFSNCGVILEEIIKFFNENGILPQSIDSSARFRNYKEHENNTTEDYSKYFFEEKCAPTKVEEINYLIPFQYQKYKDIDFEKIKPLIEAYFSPSSAVIDIIATFKNKYNIDYDNTCSVYYRGNDKIQETGLAEYKIFFNKTEEILQKNPNIKFLIQTDELEFAEAFKQRFPNSFWFDELSMINHNPDSSVHHSLPRNERKQHACYFLAAIIIMSKTKHLITYSGNCGLWTVLYRGNTKNVHQYLKTKNWKTGEIKKDWGWI